MDLLPQEVIEKIMSDLDVEDIINFSTTCRRLRAVIISSSALWKRKFFHRYRKLSKHFNNDNSNFLHEIQYLYKLKKRCIPLLQKMFKDFYKEYIFSRETVAEWNELVAERSNNYFCLMTILREILDTDNTIDTTDVVPFGTPGSLTLKFYAKEALYFLKRQHVAKLFRAFLNLPQENQVLEKCLSLIAQWFMLDIEDDEIENRLDDLANLVKKKLHEINPNHPIFKTSQADLDLWKKQIASRNQWTAPNCHEVMAAMQQVLFSDLGFYVEPTVRVSVNVFINEVLDNKAGTALVLGVIYESVGRRLGLYFFPVATIFNNLFFTFAANDQEPPYLVDVCNSGALTSPLSEYLPPGQHHETATASHFFEWTVGYLNAMPRDSLKRKLCQYPLDASIDQLTHMFRKVRNVSASRSGRGTYIRVKNQHYPHILMMRTLRSSEFFGFRREESVKYAVGMIMVCTLNQQRCVIYDWITEKIDLLFVSPSNHRNVETAAYYVLLEDGGQLKVPQDSLELCRDFKDVFTHPYLGQYFSHFFINHFVPNEELERLHPEDKKIRIRHCAALLERT